MDEDDEVDVTSSGWPSAALRFFFEDSPVIYLNMQGRYITQQGTYKSISDN